MWITGWLCLSCINIAVVEESLSREGIIARGDSVHNVQIHMDLCSCLFRSSYSLEFLCFFLSLAFSFLMGLFLSSGTWSSLMAYGRRCCKYLILTAHPFCLSGSMRGFSHSWSSPRSLLASVTKTCCVRHFRWCKCWTQTSFQSRGAEIGKGPLLQPPKTRG